jgi:antitoxin MazE
MESKIQKWGNSLALRIPKSFADEAHLTCGGSVKISEQDGGILIMPIRRKTRTLDEMVSRITKQNRHGEISSGIIGKENFQ